jgi:hypothetical protein
VRLSNVAIGTYHPQYRPLSAIRYLDVNPLPTRYTLFISLHGSIMALPQSQVCRSWLASLLVCLAIHQDSPAQRLHDLSLDSASGDKLSRMQRATAPVFIGDHNQRLALPDIAGPVLLLAL